MLKGIKQYGDAMMGNFVANHRQPSLVSSAAAERSSGVQQIY
jgi:hypothetical protein